MSGAKSLKKFWDWKQLQDENESLKKRITELEARQPLTDNDIKRLIVAFGEEFHTFDSMPEVCLLVDYDPAVGKVPEHWEPKWQVFHCVRYVLHAAYGIRAGNLVEDTQQVRQRA